jgi:hypothetical protein
MAKKNTRAAGSVDPLRLPEDEANVGQRNIKKDKRLREKEKS